MATRKAGINRELIARLINDIREAEYRARGFSQDLSAALGSTRG